MYDPPAYLWALTIAGPSAIAAAACIALYRGGADAGLPRRRAALLGGAAAVLLGGWFAGLLGGTPSTAPIGELPLALVISADVPLMIALHILSLVALTRSGRPVKAPLTGDPKPLEAQWT